MRKPRAFPRSKISFVFVLVLTVSSLAILIGLRWLGKSETAGDMLVKVCGWCAAAGFSVVCLIVLPPKVGSIFLEFIAKSWAALGTDARKSRD